MLTIWQRNHQLTRRGVTRRELLLRIGTPWAGRFGIARSVGGQSVGRCGGIIKDKAVVMLNLQGGPTHIETFDPKMTAPVEYRAITGEVKTSIPGVTFGSTFSKLAKLADKISRRTIVRP